MPTVNLTKRTLDATKPGDEPVYLWDESLKGFGAVVHPSGQVAFYARYTVRAPHPQAGRDRRMVLGRHGPLTVEAARGMAHEVLGRVARGEDPAGDRQEQLRAAEDAERQALTIRDLVTLYRERELPQRKPRTREEYDRLLDRVILPRFGSKPIGEVTRREVADLRAAMATHPVNFNRARKMLAILYTFAEREGLTEGGSPTLFVKPYPETKRERRLSFEELKAIGAALAAVEVEQPERRTEIAYIRLSLLTGCRKTELLGARWDQVDLDRGLLVLPDAKTGAREVRLAPPAVAILRELLERTEREWIFPSRKKPGARLRDPRKTFAEVCKRAGLTPPAKLAKDEARRRRVRIHDLRRTTGSVGADLGLSLHAVGHLLGHSDPRTTTIYARLGGDAAHAAADRVAGAVAAALDGKPPAEVVPLDRGRAS